MTNQNTQIAGNRDSKGLLLIAAVFMGLALLGSGTAGLVNEVVWQRSLQRFLGGNETVSSMIVVLVFMAGLGFGSLWMSRRMVRVKDPLRALAFVELSLCVVNHIIRVILGSSLGDSVFHFQRMAVSSGVPLPVLYMLSAAVVLFIPCWLMGATMPLAAEAVQKRLGMTDPRLLGVLFFVNTAGGVCGAVIASGYLIPLYGYSRSLAIAADLNLIAGAALAILLLLIGKKENTVVDVEAIQPTPAKSGILPKPSLEEILAFGLGFCSLGYEMYLFRLIPLRHEPLPFTFATVLAGFLLFWSIGAGLGSRNIKISIPLGLLLCAIFAVITPVFIIVDNRIEMMNVKDMAAFVLTRFFYFIPCLFFGYLFTRVASRAAKAWGRDVGRIYAWNTAGCCAGILGITLIGYEMPLYLMVLLIGLLLMALRAFFNHKERGAECRAFLPKWVYPLAGAVVVMIVSFVADLTGIFPDRTVFFGRDGVVYVHKDGSVILDGLWHSKLSKNNDHIGTINWFLAVCPAVSHSGKDMKDVCVIGLGLGVTASTLSHDPSVEEVDAYEIDHTLEYVFDRYREGSLDIAENPKINIIWQDARTGMSLNPKKYDIISAQPVYLKQSGGALLNSEEFYRLIGSRLKPGGIYCIYSNGTAEQAFVVRQTAAKAFPYCESFFNGYLLVCSNDPFEVTEKSLQEVLLRPGAFWDEVRNCRKTNDAASILSNFDYPRLSWGDGRIVITDDYPIVEYPEYVSARIKEAGYNVEMPKPGLKDGK